MGSRFATFLNKVGRVGFLRSVGFASLILFLGEQSGTAISIVRPNSANATDVAQDDVKKTENGILWRIWAIQ